MSTEGLMEGLSTKLILVIDDQNSMRSVLKSYFRNMGFERVETAIDGKDGMNFLMQNAGYLVVCDWLMLKMSGLELLKIVRLNGETKNLPFLMVTFTSDISVVKNALELGVS
ncbi:MAG: two-component system chemotaxis response regulator CheY [Oleiphilaceae bacterium]|jgi:two-component system chemotaxis response regulator CheY